MMFLSQKPVSIPSSSATLMLCIFVVLFSKGCIVGLSKNTTFPAIIVFGDSILDPGNNNYINTIIKCDFAPYGRDFQGGKLTGGFSNGKVPSDFAAEFYGIKELLPAYLDPNLNLQDLLTGVSFASGGTGYDPLTSKIVSVLSLSDQLELFKEYKEKIKLAMGEEQTTNFLSKVLFIICTGSNDVANSYFTTPFRRAHYDIDSYTNLTISSASQFFQELYGEGARRIAILGLPPIGCVPSQRTLGGGKQRACVEAVNRAATLFNSKLSAQVDSLKKSLPGLKTVYYDIYNPLLSIIQKPQKYGFEKANKGCCGTGNIEVSIPCNQLSNQKTCRDASKFVFWDSYHATEAAYKIISSIIVNQHLNDLL